MLMKIDSVSTIKLITACQDNVGLRKTEIFSIRMWHHLVHFVVQADMN